MSRECQCEKIPNTRKQGKNAGEGKRMVSMLGKNGESCSYYKYSKGEKRRECEEREKGRKWRKGEKGRESKRKLGKGQRARTVCEGQEERTVNS
jgi:hypothetical protein